MTAIALTVTITNHRTRPLPSLPGIEVDLSGDARLVLGNFDMATVAALPLAPGRSLVVRIPIDVPRVCVPALASGQLRVIARWPVTAAAGRIAGGEPSGPVSAVARYLTHMANLSVSMLRDAIRALDEFDGTLARGVSSRDSAMAHPRPFF